jgi:hypothetical protein
VPNVLLVATDPGETAPLRDELERRGHAVAVAPGSFYALTLLERNAPDLLVAWPDIGEPAAEELSAILAQDPATARVRLAVLCQDGHRPAVPRGVALIEAGPTAELATLLERLIHAPAGGPGDDPEAARRPAAEGGSLVGRLDTIQLVHLVQALAQLRRTGCLRVMFFTAESSTYFCEGRLLHATFGNLVAEEALTESLLEAEAQPGALFAFDRYDEERIGRVPRTIASRLESVLLEASAQIDERRDAAAPPGRR